MTKGKYAERARTKRSADGATVLAIQEQNRLRARISQLEHLEPENANLRSRNERLRQELQEQRELNVEGASDRTRWLESQIVGLEQRLLEWQRATEDIRHQQRVLIDETLALFRTLPKNATYWRLMKAWYPLVVRDEETVRRWNAMSLEQFKADLLKGSAPRGKANDDEESVHARMVAKLEELTERVAERERANAEV